MDMSQEVSIIHDVESSGLLDDSTVDYTASPWKLKPEFKIHVVSVLEEETGLLIAFYDGPTIKLDGRSHIAEVDGNTYKLEDYTPLEYKHFQLHKFKDYVTKRKIKKATAHNGINFDLLVYKAAFGIDYTIGEDGIDTWAGKNLYHHDTLVVAKALNPDRFGGNSLDNLSKIAGGDRKVDFRSNIHKNERFKHFAADMLYYNLFDIKSNLSVSKFLEREAGTHDWSSAITLEKCVADLITRQSHRGFAFNAELAKKNINELDALMEEARQKVEPILPAKKATKGLMKEFTPPATQFKKDGSLSVHMTNFINRVGASIIGDTLTFNGNTFNLPLKEGESLVKTSVASINDSTHIKEWLVSLGWNPSEWKEKDITTDTKKRKLSQEKYIETVKRYVEQTLESPFCEARCDFLECTPKTLERTLLSKFGGRSVRVITNPSFTRGQDKEMCPDLERLSSSFPYARDVVTYLTYKHRRNSILGGGVEWEDEEEADKGYISAVRGDGRIPTPADTCGAATSRMKHKLVANIPRITSLYGENMRGLFGADPNSCYQIGYDFASLEARIEAHYCFKYEEPTEEGKRLYCESLLQEKPNDVHCYSEDTEILTSNGWKTFGTLTSEDFVAQWDKGVVEFVKPLGIVWQDYKGEMIHIFNQAMDQLVTPNHRVITVDPRSGLTTIREAREFLKLSSQFAVPTAGVYSKEVLDDDFVKLLVAVQADGCFAKDCSAVLFTFVKERKYERLIALLDKLGAPYTTGSHERKGRKELKVRILSGDFAERVRSPLGTKKELPFSLVVQGYASVIVEESKFWDGTQRGGNTSVLDTTCLDTRDFLQACAVVSGSNAYCQTYTKTGSYGECTIHRCLVNESTRSKTFKSSKDVKIVNYSGKIGCVSVPSGLVVVRRNGKSYVSGNTMMAKRIAGIIEQPFERGPAKSVKYACTYGAQAAKVAKTIGSSLSVGDKVFTAFWDAALPLKLLKQSLQRAWEVSGKKYILTIDGRKVPTRAAHAILNSLFQSAGVICAKRTMVRWESKMREEGLLIDFWKEDWKNSTWGQQMIAYHDESQIEVVKSLVKFKVFSTKEQCNEFRLQEKESSGKIWSEAHESPKGGWFVAYSRVGELVVEAVEETSAFYKLNVPLSADYVVGRSWADCH